MLMLALVLCCVEFMKFSAKFLQPDPKTQHKDGIQVYSSISLHCVKHQCAHGWHNAMQGLVLYCEPAFSHYCYVW